MRINDAYFFELNLMSLIAPLVIFCQENFGEDKHEKYIMERFIEVMRDLSEHRGGNLSERHSVREPGLIGPIFESASLIFSILLSICLSLFSFTTAPFRL